MNDRYKLLAVEAAEWCKQYAKGTPVAWEWEEKFAELIVQECLYQIQSIMDYTDHETVELQLAELRAQRDAQIVIKEHFGIT